MDYKVQFTKQAEKDLDKIRRGSKKTFENISVHLLALKKFPHLKLPVILSKFKSYKVVTASVYGLANIAYSIQLMKIRYLSKSSA